MKIISRAFEAVTEAELRSIRSLLSDAFPEITDGFYRRQVPACLVTATEGEAIVGQLAVHERPVLIDGEAEVIGIIGLVAVAHTHRRRGVAANMLVKAHDYLRSKGIAYSILFAVSEKYYTGAGYREMENETAFIEDGESKTFVYRGGMALSLSERPWAARRLDLQGEVV